ncbi:MAG: toxin-antitoxin system HicB family antitoxin [Bacteroidales bacterium]|nr:toxin-antitoxin system HicB family antitoxin [Bacteroidales bacterium]
MESARIQTVLRLPPELMDRVRRNARKQKCSFNSYVEQILDQATEPRFPSIPDDFQVGAEIEGLGRFSYVDPSADELRADPKLAYLWQKYGKS